MAASLVSETNSRSGRLAGAGRHRRASSGWIGAPRIRYGAGLLPKQKTLSSSRYVGRVGALAVALGVGAAIASMPAVAFADATGSADSAGSSSSSSSSEAGSSGAGAAPTSAAGSSDSGDSSTGSVNDVSSDTDTDLDTDADADFDLDTDADADTDTDFDFDATASGDSGSMAVDDGSVSDSSVLAGAGAVSDEVKISAAEVSVGTPDGVAAESGAGAGQQDPGDGLDVPAAALGMAAVGVASRREASSGAVTMASQQGTSQFADPTDANVLVIGIDGTRLSSILDDPANVNLFALMAGGDIVTSSGTTPIAGGTTAASTIVGHTTISLPSWTTILGGVWGEEAGVINNVFYTKTADEYPTMFNTLETTFGNSIQTMAIANWIGTAAISDAESLGTPGADVVQYVEDFENDPIWTQSDDRVAELTVQAIEGTNPGCDGQCPVPDFLFSYFVGVDNTGHEFGGGSPEYNEALRKVDENVGEIMQAVLASGEDWTVIVVTDHGQSTTRGPIGALAHGFQTPEETTTFVIAWDGGATFESGAMNNQYSIVDISPTVLDLFGGPALPPSWYEGVPLSNHDPSTVKPVDPDELRVTLQDSIEMYGYPDIVTDLSLGMRTVFATVAMVVYDLTNSIIAAVEEILPSGLSWLITVPVQIIGDLLYMWTNVPAQIVALATGVSGASIFPLLPPEPPSPPLAPTLPESPNPLTNPGAEAGDSVAV